MEEGSDGGSANTWWEVGSDGRRHWLKEGGRKGRRQLGRLGEQQRQRGRQGGMGGEERREKLREG